ncbi:MAG: rod shape-determining protein MreD [Betaproteobacteria bacterium]|nr:rod shape-determining protein MreD [Betaproteobacteria bacterium]
MQTPSNYSRRILRPAHPWFIALSLFIALLLNMLSTGQWLFMPDWVMLTLCFWNMREGRTMKMRSSFFLGLVMDVANGAALGQHALAYVLVGYTAGSISRRMFWFSLTRQTLLMLPLFLSVTALQIFIRLMAGETFPGWGLFISPVITALLWPPASLLLLLPQYQPEERDENRPIL